MKPKDLKDPMKWEERSPLLSDSVFYVPEHYFAHHEYSPPGWGENFLFGNQNPICIEYCSGNGDWVVSRAKQASKLNWIAVEKKFHRVRKIWSKVKNEKLDNLIVVRGEAATFTHHYIPEKIVEAVFINFPDPWPKRKHAKHRLIKEPFVADLARILKAGRKVTFVTDDLNYLKETIDLFGSHRSFFPTLPKPYYTDQADSYGTSWFEMLWRKKKRTICYTQFYTYD